MVRHEAAAAVARGCGGGGTTYGGDGIEVKTPLLTVRSTKPPKMRCHQNDRRFGRRSDREGAWSMHIEVPRHFWAQKSPLLRGEWPLQNPRVFTSRERSFGPPCLDAFHLWSMGG